MKRRLFALLLTLCLTLTLAACSNSTEDVEAAIDAIGTVTMESEDAIQDAKRMYDALSADDQAKVRNADELMAAIDEFDRLSGAVDLAIDSINAIGFVDLNSGEEVALARSAYDALAADNLYDYVSESYYAVLLEAEESYGMLYVAEAYAQAEEMFGWGDYINSEATLYDAVTRFPNDALIPQCNDLGSSCLARTAKDYYLNSDLEHAMYTLTHCDEVYGGNAESCEVRESVEAALAQKRPATGQVFKNSVGSAYGKLTVNASDSDACVKLELICDPSQYILFYIRSGEHASVYVPDGEYVLKYTTGPYWFNVDSMFGQYGSFAQADDVLVFETIQEGNSVYYDAITITLYSVVNGNLPVEDISGDDF